MARGVQNGIHSSCSMSGTAGGEFRRWSFGEEEVLAAGLCRLGALLTVHVSLAQSLATLACVREVDFGGARRASAPQILGLPRNNFSMCSSLVLLPFTPSNICIPLQE